MKLRIIILSSFILLSNLSAVGEAGAIFLLISPGAGPQGTGEAQVAKANDAYASYYNPAGFGFLKGREAAGMHVQWLPNLADDLYYEFLAYRHYIEGLGSIGGHIIYLNLGEQIGMDALGNPTTNWMSFMSAASASFGTKLSKNSSIGFNVKVFHQKLSDTVTEGEKGKGHSTDFAFDVGYLKKFKRSSKVLRKKKEEKINRFFNHFTQFYNQQLHINEKIFGIKKNESNIYDIVEDQEVLIDEIEIQKVKITAHMSEVSSIDLDDQINSIISNMDALIDSLNEINLQATLSSTSVNIIENIITISDNLSFKLMEIGSFKENILAEIKEMDIEEDTEDKFNFGFCISNIGPKIAFVDEDQADPSPTNMRLGLFAQLYNDGNNKINLLFDANKLLVARYPEMDWNGDGKISGAKEKAHDDPWYAAIFTAWLDDWYFGGDFNYNNDDIIGGYICESEPIEQSNGQYECAEGWQDNSDEYDFSDPNYGIYGQDDNDADKAKIEKGSGNNRSFSTELKEMIYNVGLEYWYTDNFALRAGYIYDDEGKVINPTFGAGIRLLQYGFDFGYTAGKTGHPRANTMFFSINMNL